MPPTDQALRECPHCGARVSLPAGRISEMCSFCDTPLVAWDGHQEPVDRVAPFVLDRRQANQRLRQHLRGHTWAPTRLKRLDPEDLHGVLVPFYCYDADARSRYSARVGIYWYRTETYTVVVNGKTQIRTRTVRETEWFPTSGTHVASYRDHLVSGSRGLPEAESNELEPFDLGLARPFAPGLVAGWPAELPDVTHAEARQVATQELAGLENSAIGKFLPANTYADVKNDTTMDVGEVRLVLLPVYTATYKHKGKEMRLLVNGQTGEVVGKVPRSWVKITLAIVIPLLLLLGAAACAGIIAMIVDTL